MSETIFRVAHAKRNVLSSAECGKLFPVFFLRREMGKHSASNRTRLGTKWFFFFSLFKWKERLHAAVCWLWVTLSMWWLEHERVTNISEWNTFCQYCTFNRGFHSWIGLKRSHIPPLFGYCSFAMNSNLQVAARFQYLEWHSTPRCRFESVSLLWHKLKTVRLNNPIGICFWTNFLHFRLCQHFAAFFLHTLTQHE